MRRSVAVIGGGITGLAAAHRLRELDPATDVLLLEAGGRLGGVLETTPQEGFLVEAAADGFLTSPTAAVDLCRRVGLEHDLIEPAESCRQALVLNRGRLTPVPTGFYLMAPSRLWPLFSSPLLSWPGKLRAAAELVIPGRTDPGDESLQSFVCRRFGRQVFERIVQPLVGGIYAADPQQLSTEATFPRFRQMEREHGSLIRAMVRRTGNGDGRAGGGARYGQFMSLRGGMSTLVAALADRLPRGSVRLDSPVTALFPLARGGWQVVVGGGRPAIIPVDGVVIAAPARRSAHLLERVDPGLAVELRNIEYASCAVVALGYRREQIKHPLNGFGFVVPHVEQRLILSCSFASVKYAGRAPDDAVLLRVFIGGACQRGLMWLSRDELGELAAREVADMLRIDGDPILSHVMRQQQAMPQYHVGHRERMARIDARVERFPTLALAGSGLHGIGVPSCIQSGQAAAERIVKLSETPERTAPVFSRTLPANDPVR